MRRRPYPDVLAFIEHDIGIIFDDTDANIGAIAEHMDWDKGQVRAVLGILAQQRAIRVIRNRSPRLPRRWQIADACIVRRGRPPQTTKAPAGAHRQGLQSSP